MLFSFDFRSLFADSFGWLSVGDLSLGVGADQFATLTATVVGCHLDSDVTGIFLMA